MKSYGLSDLPGSPGEGQSESSPLEQVLQQVRSGDPDACGALYSLTNKGVRLILRRHLGHDDVEAIVQEVYADLFRGIRVGLVPRPESLGGFLRDIVHSHIAHATPAEASVRVAHEDVERMGRALACLSRSARALLSSYILQGRSREEACDEARVSVDQFRATLTAAKNFFARGTRAASNHTAAGA